MRVANNAARIQIPASTPYVRWICYWFFALLREIFFPVHSGSPHSSKINISKFQFDQNGCAASNSLFIYLFQLFISSFCCCLSYRALVKWIAPSVVTMKCVFHTTKITVYDVFVRLDIQEHLAVSYMNIWLCHKLSVTSNSVMTKNVDPFSPSVLRVLYATGR